MILIDFLLNSYPELVWTLFECDRMKNAELDRETGYLCSLLGASALFYPDQLFIQFSLIDNIFSILGHRKSHCQQDGTSQFPFQPNFIRETQRQKLMAGQHVIFLGQSGNDEPISSYHFGKHDL